MDNFKTFLISCTSGNRKDKKVDPNGVCNLYFQKQQFAGCFKNHKIFNNLSFK